jgi:hypothetical protein
MAERLDVARVLVAVEELVVAAPGAAAVVVPPRLEGGRLGQAAFRHAPLPLQAPAKVTVEAPAVVVAVVVVETAERLAVDAALVAVHASQGNALLSLAPAADSAQRRKAWAQT